MLMERGPKRSEPRRRRESAVGRPVPMKFRRVDAAIRKTADSFLLAISREITAALAGPRTAEEEQRLLRVQQECGNLQQATLRLLVTLHGLDVR